MHRHVGLAADVWSAGVWCYQPGPHSPAEGGRSFCSASSEAGSQARGVLPTIPVCLRSPPAPVRGGAGIDDAALKSSSDSQTGQLSGPRRTERGT